MQSCYPISKHTHSWRKNLFFLEKVCGCVSERLLLSNERCWDSWPLEERDSVRDQWWGLITQSFCVIKFSVQFSSVAQLCPTLCVPMNCSMPGLPVHHQLPEFTETHVHLIGDATQPSYPLSPPSHPAPNPSQHQGLSQWVNSSHQVAKLLEF